MDGSFFLTHSFVESQNDVCCLVFVVFWSQQTVFFRVIGWLSLVAFSFWKRSFCLRLRERFFALFLLIELFDRWFLIKRNTMRLPYFKDKIKHNHSYNILTNNRLSDLIYPSFTLSRSSLIKATQAQLLIAPITNNVIKLDQNLRKSLTKNSRIKKAPSHFSNSSKERFSKGWSPTWRNTRSREIYCNYIIQGSISFHSVPSSKIYLL